MSVRSIDRSVTKLSLITVCDELYTVFNTEFCVYVNEYLYNYYHGIGDIQYYTKATDAERDFAAMLNIVTFIWDLAHEYDNIRRNKCKISVNINARMKKLYKLNNAVDMVILRYTSFCRRYRHSIKYIGKYAELLEKVLSTVISCKRYEYQHAKVIGVDVDPKLFKNINENPALKPSQFVKPNKYIVMNKSNRGTQARLIYLEKTNIKMNTKMKRIKDYLINNNIVFDKKLFE